MCQHQWGHSHGVNANPYNPTGTRSAKSGNITIELSGMWVMPVLDRKPKGRNNDDEHHSKLVHRQHKSNTQ